MSNTANTPGMSLSRRLLLLGALPAVVIFVALMVFFTSARLEDAHLDLAQSSQMLADSLAPALEYAVVSGNSTALEQVLGQSLKRSKADWIRVTDVVDEAVSRYGAIMQGTNAPASPECVRWRVRPHIGVAPTAAPCRRARGGTARWASPAASGPPPAPCSAMPEKPSAASCPMSPA